MQHSTFTVFVYGTLRSGASNHFRMHGAKFLTSATLRGRLYLIDWFPGLVLDDAAGAISGEIYQVTPELMTQLDDFEGSDYRRVIALARPIENDHAPIPTWVWEWQGQCDESRLIHHGDWLAQQEAR